jgi:diaminohydroxyphosphoribosylaminopyrimidine deaminase/5-amino-6-(5-phosphoribosylamino)uracil reductase
VLASGLRRIVVGMKDPNPLVAGRGIRALRRAGIRVEVGCLGKEAERLNQFYCHWRRTGRPFVILKAAMTLDGKIATAGGESRWITGPAARREVHRLRSQVDAILVGIGTVLRDDPRLTARPPHRAGHAPRQPLRVILDSTLRIPPSARVLTRPPGSPTVNTLIVTTVRAPRQRIRRLRERGVGVLVLPASRGQVSLRACLAHLGKRGISSALIEGGSRIHASALRENLVDHVKLFVAPRLLGGQDAKAVIGGASPKRLAEAVPLHRVSVTNLDGDFLIEGTPAR